MFWYLIFLALLLAAGALVWVAEQHRRQTKASRFAARHAIKVEDIIKSEFPDAKNPESLALWWKRAADILRIDAQLLRKGDRFDGILSRVPGYPTEDELDVLTDYVIDTCGLDVNEDAVCRIETFGQLVELLADSAVDF